MGKRKRARTEHHDPLPRPVVVATKFGMLEVDKITETWKFQTSISRSDVFSKRAAPKVKKSLQNHISSMPDDVLQYIVTFLPTREGARTSVLSGRWRNIWSASASCLNCNAVNMFGSGYNLNRLKKGGKCLISRERRKFVRRVNQILQVRQSKRMEALRICCFLGRESTSSIDRWVELAESEGVRELDLDFETRDTGLALEYKKLYRFPFRVFSHGSASLMHLHLKACIFRVPRDFRTFISLLSINLADTWISPISVRNIMSNCSFLEWFSMRNCICSGSTILEFAGPSLRLKHLSIVSCFRLTGIEVVAVNLVSFEYSGQRVQFAFKDITRVVRLHLGFSPEVNLDGVTDGLNELPTSFPHVQTLSLSVDPLVLQASILPRKLPTFTNVRRLVFHTWTHITRNLQELTYFLEACPMLQKLELNVHVCDDKQLITTAAATRTENQGSSHDNLKEIEMYGFCGFENEIDLASCLLKRATTLEKMTIYTCLQSYWGNGKVLYKKSEMKACIPSKELHRILQREARSTMKLSIFSQHDE